jgi:thiosulfate dehydrogenase
MKLSWQVWMCGLAALMFGSAGAAAVCGAFESMGLGQDSPTGVVVAKRAAEDRAALGERIFHYTPDEAKPYVGNRLSCNSCHFQDGKAAHAAPMIDVALTFPQFSERAKRTITLKDRIQECFVRSENGHPLPENGREMTALVAYIDSLSAKPPRAEKYSGRGLVKVPNLKGNPVRGESIYVGRCAVCHGFAGEGVGPMLPPVWGNDSFNDGAGMNKVEKMAAFVLKNMPQTNPGSLTPQEAFDVSAFIQSKPHPKLNPQYAKF